MTKIVTVVFLSLALIGSAAADMPRQETSRDTSGSAHMSEDDSLSFEIESLPPLTLRAAYDTSGEARSSLLPLEGSWMHEPKGMPQGPPPLEFLFEPFSYGTDGETVPDIRSSNWLLDTRTYLMSPWKLEMQSRSKYRILRTILGSVQVGGVAYLMYLHLKKYGLK